MNILIAPQAFKSSLNGMEIAIAISEGIHRVSPEAKTVLLPVADGGDGTLDILVNAPSLEANNRGEYFRSTVVGPLGESVEAYWGGIGYPRSAIIEMARASGLVLVPPNRRDPRTSTTYGTGELIRSALDAKYTDIIVGLGGSATNDGGAGMAKALGARLLDARGKELTQGGAALAGLKTIDLEKVDPRLTNTRLRGAADVMNPLCGTQGATHIYGPQKGATMDMVLQLDDALHHYADVVERETGVEVLNMPGAGAAGGTGAGFVALLGGDLLPGADIVCDAVGLNEHLRTTDLVFIGEGRLDGQTIYNKAPLAVARRAKDFGLPVIAIVGSLGQGYENLMGQDIDTVEAAADDDMLLEEAITEAGKLVRSAAERGMKSFLEHN